jgi:hypothetical protein
MSLNRPTLLFGEAFDIGWTQLSEEGSMKGICGVLTALLRAVFIAYFVPAAAAAPTAVITPYVYCADRQETVPAGQEIVIRSAWATGSWGNVSKFLDSQGLFGTSGRSTFSS